MEWVKCDIAEGAEMSLEYRPGEWSRHLGRGAILNLDEKVGKRVVDDVERDVLVRDLIAGREALFVPVDRPAKAAPPVPAPAKEDSKKQ